MKLPQFTSRDLFWLLLVAAIVSAWMADRRYYVAHANRRVLFENRAVDGIAIDPEGILSLPTSEVIAELRKSIIEVSCSRKSNETVAA